MGWQETIFESKNKNNLFFHSHFLRDPHALELTKFFKQKKMNKSGFDGIRFFIVVWIETHWNTSENQKKIGLCLRVNLRKENSWKNQERKKTETFV